MPNAIKPSLRLAALLLSLHSAALSVIVATSASLSVRVAAAIVVMISLSYYLARDILLLSHDSWIEISLEQDRVSLVNHGGAQQSGALTGRAVVSPHFIALGVKLDGHSLPAFRLIFPDSLGAGAFRELCVRLRYPQ